MDQRLYDVIGEVSDKRLVRIAELEAALEQIRALQPNEPTHMDQRFPHRIGVAWGHWEAAQIADAAIREQGKGKEGK